MRRSRAIRSAATIAKLLGAEGFTDHLANKVEQYWKQRSGLTERQHRKIEKLDKAITDICQKLTEGEKLTLGKFIGLHKKMSFDVGLRVGLQAFATKVDKEITVSELP